LATARGFQSLGQVASRAASATGSVGFSIRDVEPDHFHVLVGELPRRDFLPADEQFQFAILGRMLILVGEHN